MNSGWPHWIRQLAIGTALLLALACLDSGWPASPPPASGAPSPSYGLDVTLAPSDAPSETLGGSLTVFREIRGTYERVWEGAVSSAGEHLDLREGHYFLVGRAPGRARIAEELLLEKSERRRLVLPPAQPRHIEVLVSRGDELAPLADVTVLVRESASQLPFGRATDTAGKAVFEDTPPGELEVIVYARGYEPYEAVIEGDLLVRLRPVRLLRISVTHDGRPVPGATVSIAGLSLWPARTVQTGAQGHVDVSGLKAGRYTLSATSGELVSQNSSLDLRGDEGIEEVELALGPGFFASARVHDAQGAALPGVRVTYAEGGLGTRQLHAITDEQGLFRIGPLLALEGQLQVSKDGYVTRVLPLDATGPHEIELIRSGSITGHVVDAQGRPVAGATIEIVGTDLFGMPVSVTWQGSAIESAHFDWALQSQNALIPAGELGVLLGPVPAIPLAAAVPQGGQSLTTNERGWFSASDVPPGELVVLARHPDHMDGKSAVVTVGAGESREVEVVLGSGEPLRGRILDHRDFPATDARVEITGLRFERRVAVEPDGTFSLAAAPEKVRLRVSRTSRPLAVLLEHEVATAERQSEIRIVLPPPREAVEISCQSELGEPISLAQVTLVSMEKRTPLRLTRFTDASGKLLLEEARDLSARIEVSAPDFVQKIVEKKLAATETLRLVRSIAASGRITSVRGRQPAVGARVTYVAGSVERGALTNDLGEYRLTGLPPGRGELSAELAGVGKGRTALTLAVPTSGRDASLPDLDLAAPLLVSGRVLDAAGAPVARAVLATDRIGAYVGAARDPIEVGVSGADGTFQVELEPAEPLYLFAMRPGHGFGFSDRIVPSARGEARDVVVLLDRIDEVTPDVRATVLVSLEEDPSGTGLVVYSVARGSAAARSGLRPLDRLLAVDGDTDLDVETARELLSGWPGTDVLIEYSRGGVTRAARVQREAFRR